MGKSVLIILSVALNTAFVATCLVRSLPARAHGAAIVLCPPPALRLEGADWQDFQSRQAAFRARSRAQCQEINRLRSQLIDLLASPQPDAKAIQTKQDQTLTAQRRMQSLVIEYLLHEKQRLTSEQQRTLFALIRQRCGCSGHDALMGQGASVGAASAAHDCAGK